MEFAYRREVPGKLTQLTSCQGKFNLHNYILRQEGRLVKANTTETAQTMRPLIVVANAKYTFELLTTNKDDQYVIHKLDMLPPNGRTPFLPMLGPISDWSLNRTFMEIAQDPEVEFASLTDAKFRGADVKELKLVVPGINPVTKKDVKSRKSYFFAPERAWLCVGWTEGFVEPGATKYVEDYYGYEGEGTYPPLKLIERVVRDRSDPSFSQLLWRMEFTKFSRVAPFEDAEFRLSAFGLPEPPGADWKRPIPWWLWLCGAGTLCLMLAGFVYWLKWRRPAAAAS